MAGDNKLDDKKIAQHNEKVAHNKLQNNNGNDNGRNNANQIGNYKMKVCYY